MRRWYWLCLGPLGLAFGSLACDAPEQIVPTTPPGAVIPRTPPEGEEAAQAQGEVLTATAKAKNEATKKNLVYTPATPTAKGETKTTKNGVRYETLKEGTGDELKPDKVALVHYEGKLEDGTVFESSRKKGEPLKVAFGTGQLVKGWEEGLPGMRVGEIRKLFIPAALGYQDRSAPGGKIPPNSNLLFEVELVKILN
jgi:FKBP-type peptidyl-prolyl cis-trans isomerase